MSDQKPAVPRELKSYTVDSYIMILLFFILFAIIMFQVVCRVIGFTVVWTSELIRFLFIWLCFVGIIAGTRWEEHVGTNIFRRYLSENGKFIVTLISKVICIIFSIILLYGSMQLVIRQLSFNRMASTIPIPMFLVTSILPLTFGINLLILLKQLFNNIKEKI